MLSSPQNVHRLLALLAISMASPSASAHLVSTRFGEFYAGLLHPLTTMLHLVPWIALGLLAVLQGKADTRRNVLVFPVAVALGVVVGGLAPGYTAPAFLNLVSIVVLGAMLALARPLSSRAFYLLAGIVGLSHGYDNAVANLGIWDSVLYVSGVATAAYLLIVLLGAGSLSTLRFAWGLIAARAAGSWILASGLLFAAFTLVGPSGV